MNLHNLTPAEGSTKKGKRIARGEGSRGGTSTRGNKGAQARAGYHSKRGFEGGQMPLHKRIPKYGFTNINRKEFHGINLDTIQEVAEKGGVKKVNKGFFVEHGLASKSDRIKVLGRGSDKYSATLEVEADAFSSSAKAAIEKSGKAIIAVRQKAEPKPVAEKPAAKAPKAAKPKAEAKPAKTEKKPTKKSK
jgi:large subunit ribosomal protein L15